MLTLPKYKTGDKVMIHYPATRWDEARDEEHEVLRAGPKWLTIQISRWQAERFNVATGLMDRGAYASRESDAYVTTPEWEAVRLS